MRSLLVMVLLIVSLFCFAQTDTLVVDDYPVTVDMLRTSGWHNVHNGNLQSYDMAWFKNDTLKQVLAVYLATDYHHFYTFHFYANNIPADLLSGLPIIYGHDTTIAGRQAYEQAQATLPQKQCCMQGFIDSANVIATKYFTTQKGFKLGDTKDKAVRMYGLPDSVSTTQGLQKCQWFYRGDIIAEEDRPLYIQANRVARNSFGHTITMYFKNEKLVAMVLFNDIP